MPCLQCRMQESLKDDVVLPASRQFGSWMDWLPQTRRGSEEPGTVQSSQNNDNISKKIWIWQNKDMLCPRNHNKYIPEPAGGQLPTFFSNVLDCQSVLLSSLGMSNSAPETRREAVRFAAFWNKATTDKTDLSIFMWCIDDSEGRSKSWSIDWLIKNGSLADTMEKIGFIFICQHPAANCCVEDRWIPICTATSLSIWKKLPMDWIVNVLKTYNEEAWIFA